jgi:hypothetical protein
MQFDVILSNAKDLGYRALNVIPSKRSLRREGSGLLRLCCHPEQRAFCVAKVWTIKVLMSS